MIVIIEDAVFASSHNAAKLVALFHLGFEERHRIQVDPLPEPDGESAFARWKHQQHPSIREEIELALDVGLEGAAHGIPSDHTLRIAVVDAPNWYANPPVVPLAEAHRLLQRPLQIVLENRRNDRAFLETIALEPWREHLRKAFEAGTIEPVHGGGLSGIRGYVEDLEATPGDGLRHWVLFDSDGLEPGRPSRDSEALRETCEKTGLAHHQLIRRMSENYLPPQALLAWVQLSRGSQRTTRRKKAQSFAAMRPAQRHHYNMKAGFNADRKGEHGIPELFDGPKTNPDLQEGFGGKIAAELYRDGRVRLLDEWFLRDEQKEETSRIVQAIFRAL